MTRDLLNTILADRTETFEPAKGAIIACKEAAEVQVIIATGGAPTPIPKVRELQLADGYLVVHTRTDSYYLTYESVLAIKVTHSKGDVPRTGFHQ